MNKNNLALSKNQKIVLESFHLFPKHPTAQQLYEFIHQSYHKMGLTTVYRALNFLTTTGKLKKIIGLDKKIHYDHNLDLHPHFMCQKCNKVIDIDKDCCCVSIKEIEHKMKVSCVSVEMNIQGVCSKCCLEK